MTADSQRFIEIGQRIQGLREACDVTREEMAEELEVSVETYTAWEETGADVPISAIYHMAQQFGVEFNDILNGTSSKLNTYQIVRAGQGKEVPRNPRYHYEDLAWRYVDKIMQPLLVTIDPTEKPHSPGATSSSSLSRATASSSTPRSCTARARWATSPPSSSA